MMQNDKPVFQGMIRGMLTGTLIGTTLLLLGAIMIAALINYEAIEYESAGYIVMMVVLIIIAVMMFGGPMISMLFM